MSGCPMFKFKTLCPFFFAISAKGTNFLMGDSGIAMPLLDTFGIRFYLNIG
jgi:hypothetical protein